MNLAAMPVWGPVVDVGVSWTFMQAPQGRLRTVRSEPARGQRQHNNKLTQPWIMRCPVTHNSKHLFITRFLHKLPRLTIWFTSRPADETIVRKRVRKLP